MTVYTEGRHATEAVLREECNSRANLRIAASQTVLACALLGMTDVGDAGGGAQTVSAVAAPAGHTNTGNGAPGTWTADAHAPAGKYRIVFIEPGANVGTYNVFLPDGTLDPANGTGVVATAYNGTINGTIADGATDFVAGDTFEATVSYANATGAKLFKAWDKTATDGSQTPCAVALYPATTGVGVTADIAASVWNTDMNVHCIVWPTGYDDTDKANAKAALMAGKTIYDKDGNPLTAGRINLR